MKYFDKRKVEPFKNISGFLSDDNANQQLLRSEVLDDSNKFNSLTYSLEEYILGIESFASNNLSIDNISPMNLRFRGHREAYKFNLTMQQVLSMVFKAHKSIVLSTSVIKPIEVSYPISDATISSIQHVRAQVKFLNWLKTNGPEDIWFN